MTSCSVASWSILRFQATSTLPPMTRAHSCIIHEGWCVYSSSMKQCLGSVNREQFPMQMTQNNKHNKWLEILAGKDFLPKLLWRTPTKIHRERRRRREQEAAKQREHWLSTAKATSLTQRPQTCYRGSDKILQLHCKWSRWRDGTPTTDASKSDEEIRQRLQFTVKLSSSMQR